MKKAITLQHFIRNFKYVFLYCILSEYFFDCAGSHCFVFFTSKHYIYGTKDEKVFFYADCSNAVSNAEIGPKVGYEYVFS